MLFRSSFGDAQPQELVRICRRAMDPDPGRRFGSVVDLRRALEASGFDRYIQTVRSVGYRFSSS